MTDTAPSSLTPKRPVLWTNWITLGGLLFIAIGLVLMLTFWIFELIFPSTHENQYLGLIGFMILPGILVNGLIMCPFGMWLRKRKLKKKGTIKVGQLADLAVLTADFMNIPEDEIKNLASILTVVDGAVVHGDGPFRALAPPLPPPSPGWSPVNRFDRSRHTPYGQR